MIRLISNSIAIKVLFYNKARVFARQFEERADLFATPDNGVRRMLNIIHTIINFEDRNDNTVFVAIGQYLVVDFAQPTILINDKRRATDIFKQLTANQHVIYIVVKLYLDMVLTRQCSH